MTLLESMLCDFRFMNKVRVSDGEGGYVTTWSDGDLFQAVANIDTSLAASIAGASKAVNSYTVTTRRNITLDFHDVIKRVDDGKVFRVTSDGDDKKTPSIAVLDMRQVTAEEWELAT